MTKDYYSRWNLSQCAIKIIMLFLTSETDLVVSENRDNHSFVGNLFFVN